MSWQTCEYEIAGKTYFNCSIPNVETEMCQSTETLKNLSNAVAKTKQVKSSCSTSIPIRRIPRSSARSSCQRIFPDIAENWAWTNIMAADSQQSIFILCEDISLHKL